MELKFCPFYGEKWECCKMCLNIKREEEEKSGKCMGSFYPREIDWNETHPFKCSEVKDMKEYEVNGESRHKVFCGVTQKWIENWESYMEKQGYTWD